MGEISVCLTIPFKKPALYNAGLSQAPYKQWHFKKSSVRLSSHLPCRMLAFPLALFNHLALIKYQKNSEKCTVEEKFVIPVSNDKLIQESLYIINYNLFLEILR